MTTASNIPTEILDIIGKLDTSDQDVLRSYIIKLQGDTLSADETMPKEKVESSLDDETGDENGDEPPFPAIYESGDDFEKATEYKMKASDLKASGKWEEALEQYTSAILAAEPSALLYANRAMALMELNRPRAAERDCSLALEMNPDSAKALRVRGKARKMLGKYEEALKDLSASQQIDYDENVVEDLKELTKLHVDNEKKEAQKRISEEEKMRKRASEIKRAQEEAKREAQEDRAREAAGGMPGGFPGAMPGGMPGGMPGMGGGGGMPNIMQILMSDPELAAGMSNPKVMAAFQGLLSEPGGVGGLMSNPAKLQELMADPEVGPFLNKLMAKLGPAMGMPGGMPGNMGGAAPGAANDDDIDLSDLPDLE